jgi:cytochrome b pre-mRNA-processing protein 3
VVVRRYAHSTTQIQWLTLSVVGLPKTFNTWAVVCFVHMWILKVRIRHLPRRMADHWNELLTNHFFWTAEKTMDFEHKIDATQRKKYLDSYFQVWTGAILALDEGLAKGDAVLAAALWRLLFDGADGVDPERLALATAYVRRELARVSRLDDAVLARGYVGFGQPLGDEVLAKKSSWMRAPFEEDEPQ